MSVTPLGHSSYTPPAQVQLDNHSLVFIELFGLKQKCQTWPAALIWPCHPAQGAPDGARNSVVQHVALISTTP